MTIVLEQTDAGGISAAFLSARKSAGSPAMGMVMTMVVVVPAAGAESAIEAAQEAAREHPSRVLTVVIGSARGASRIDAEIRSGSGAPGETALIRLSGEVAKHSESVVLPLLLPDSPVVVWWPTEPPADPAADPIGRLGTRRITDAAEVSTGRNRAMLTQCRSYAPGNTDLAWTRITPWRALIAAAFDQAPGKVTGIKVTAERVSPSAELLGAWLSDRLKVPVSWGRSDGPGITEVALATRDGEIRLARGDGRHATLSVPGQPDRPVGLRRRDVPELLHEELRRLDPDDIYAATVRKLIKMRDTPRSTTKKSAAKKASTKNGAARKKADKKPAGRKGA
ncbi:MAG TPA: glucose-6-phosphate dehydrogenase assembly protein OpcA [Marmoricola sp.]|nr:glucose-6-phosphate dehydrogenase assembly protein OpcA [Marmoricola sp.]